MKKKKLFSPVNFVVYLTVQVIKILKIKDRYEKLLLLILSPSQLRPAPLGL